MDRETHRRFTSRDFDGTYWRFRNHNDVSALLESLRDDHAMVKKEEKLHDCIHLSVKRTHDEESSVVSSVDGCKWRLQFIEKECIPSSIQCAVFFLQYPIVLLSLTNYA